MNSRLKYVFLFAIILTLFNCADDDGNQKPIVKILSPENGETFNVKELVDIEVEADDLDGSIEKVSFYVNDQLVKELIKKPYAINVDTSRFLAGTIEITVIAADNNGQTSAQVIDINTKVDPPTVKMSMSLVGTSFASVEGVVESFGTPELRPEFNTYYGICWNESGAPTINDNATHLSFKVTSFPTTITNDFSASMKGLKLGTKYFVRSYTTSPWTTEVFYGEEMSFTTKDSYVSDSGTFTDSRDGNQYKWVKIGNQTWMAENVRYLESAAAIIDYDDPDPTDPCNNIFDKEAAIRNENYIKYGCLYRPDLRNVAPPGWHVASMDEWSELINYVGGGQVAGAILKSRDGWGASDTPGTDLANFSVQPGGQRWYLFCSFGEGTSPGNTTSFWTTSNVTVGRDQERVYYRFDHDSESAFVGSQYIDESGQKGLYYIRCVKNTN
ncbi:FISUMP domain-containing protein [Aquimarina sp. 2304DJ70-9]|uniref:FISUMP domain-containing protein n=1 Tax=Aquimarina penaris TaxID=3231044 RepID=UPI003462C7CB